jgi:hypothetical protein
MGNNSKGCGVLQTCIKLDFTDDVFHSVTRKTPGWEYSNPSHIAPHSLPRRRAAGAPWIRNSDACGGARRSLNKNKHLLIVHFKQTLSSLKSSAPGCQIIWLAFLTSSFCMKFKIRECAVHLMQTNLISNKCLSNFLFKRKILWGETDNTAGRMSHRGQH